MPPLKLFVSHSSRLDDVDHKYTDDDRNRKLLDETCKAIRDHYGDRVDVLVDNDVLIPGEDWNHRLNLWLAECHVAIILFSKRAIDKSNWVAKEAAILSWRAELDDKFKLIPVLLDGESTPEDLAKGFLGTLKIDRSQCIRNAGKPADILGGLRKALGEPEDLASEHPQTPLEKLQGSIAKLLSEPDAAESLKEILTELKRETAPKGTHDHRNFADSLARTILGLSSGPADACCNGFQTVLDKLKPSPTKESAEQLFRLIRSLWVDPGAAAQLRAALQQPESRPLALAGDYILQADPLLETDSYTLERYLERAWLDSKFFRRVTLPGSKDLEEIKAEIRRVFLGGGLPPTIPGAKLDQQINRDPKAIVLILTVKADQGGLPDPERLTSLTQLTMTYRKLLFVFATEFSADPLPETIRTVDPPLDPERELQAYLAERAARNFFNEKYGIAP